MDIKKASAFVQELAEAVGNKYGANVTEYFSWPMSFYPGAGETEDHGDTTNPQFVYVGDFVGFVKINDNDSALKLYIRKDGSTSDEQITLLNGEHATGYSGPWKMPIYQPRQVFTQVEVNAVDAGDIEISFTGYKFRLG